MMIYFKDGKPFWNPEPRPQEKDLNLDCEWKEDTAAKKILLANKLIIEWQSSSIAIKEPEWKVGKKVYDKYGKLRGTVLGFNKIGWLLIDCGYCLDGKVYADPPTHLIECPTCKGSKNEGVALNPDSYSHYYDKQKISREKFRLVKWDYYDFAFKKKLKGWQEVKEPENPNSKASRQVYMDTQTLVKKQRKFDNHQADIQKGLIVLEQFKF